MVAIPVDVLREILGYVCKADLAALCKVNKTVCSCSQNVLYRQISYRDHRAIQTLAQSTDLARRVRSFYACGDHPGLPTALRNMSSLRSLELSGTDDDILDGCTFKLYSFNTTFRNSESLQEFLNSQPSLTNLTIWGNYEPSLPFDERCLPNLTRVRARPSWLGILIPGRPVREVTILSPSDFYSTRYSTDMSFFTLSTTPIQKLHIIYEMLYPKPGSLLVSIFPSLVHLVVHATMMEWPVRAPLCLSI
jgi:F-box domain